MHSAYATLGMTRASAAGGPAAAVAPAVAKSSSRLLTTSLALELGVLLALSVLFPVLIHVLPVPEEARLGPRLLPIFYAPLLAALLGRRRSAVAVAALAPWLNWLVTGYPLPHTAAVTMLQLLVFVAALAIQLARLGPRWFLAAPAYFSAMAVATGTVALFPGLIGGHAASAWAAQTVALAIPGLVILILINWLVIRTYPPAAGGTGPLAA